MKKSARRFWTVAAICGGIALVFTALQWGGHEYEPLQKIEFYSQDLRAAFGTKAPLDTNLVLVGIDRPSYASDFRPEDLQENPTLRLLQGNFPWSRAVWAEAIRKLAEAGAKAIVVDLVFAGESEGDAQLKDVLDRYAGQIVIGCNFKDLNSNRGIGGALDVPNSSVLNNTNIISAALDERVGFVNIWPDWDGVMRRGRYRQEGGVTTDLLPNGTMAESIDARALRKSGHTEKIPFGSDPILFRYSSWKSQHYVVHSIGDVLLTRTWKANYDEGRFFRGKIVMIGPTADIFQDTHLTPVLSENGTKQMLGPEIHLNLIAAALHDSFLRETLWKARIFITVLFGVAAFLLGFFIHKPARRLVAIVAACVAYWYLGQFLYNHPGLVIPMAAPLLVLVTSGVLVLGYDYFLEQFERARTRKTLERYVSKDIVKELLDNPATYFHSLEGVRKGVTVLFSDVRDFTALTEKSESEQRLVAQLNEYFQKMVAHVFGFQGTLDKFIGDAVMAVWGNVVTRGADRDAQHAVATALEMKRSLAQLNADWKRRGFPELAFGIGINHGEAIVGNLGSTEKMELTVIGDAVNLASRLEGLTKKYHLDLLIGETVAPLVREKYILRTVDFVQVKGKTKPVEVFTVIGEHDGKMSQGEESWLHGYEEGVKLFRQRKFSEAAQMFGECLGVKPDDYLCGMYRDSCDALIRNPPDASWSGVSVMKDK